MTATKKLEQQAEYDRDRLGETLDVLRNRMAPAQLVDQAFDYVRANGGAEFARNLGGQVKTNPLPVALIAAGIGWLVFGPRPAVRRVFAPSIAPDHDDPAPDGRFRDFAAESVPGTGDKASGTYSSAADAAVRTGESVRDAASRSWDSLTGAVGNARDYASETGQAAADRVRDMRENASNYASDIARGATDSARRARWRAQRAGERIADGAEQAQATVSRIVEEQPLVIGAVGLAIGAVLGALLPRTRREDKIMGQTSDQLKASVVDTAREGFAEAQKAGSRIVEKVRSQAETHGFTAESIEELARDVGNKVAAVASAAGESVQGELTAVKKAEQKAGRESTPDTGDMALHEAAPALVDEPGVSRFSEADPAALPEVKDPTKETAKAQKVGSPGDRR